VKNKKNLK